MATVDVLDSDDGVPGWSPLRKFLAWTVGGIVALFVLLTIAVNVIDTDPGRAWLSRQLERIAPKSGLTIRVGRLEGSLFGRLTIYDLRLGDPKGTFLVAPRVDLDWDAAALVRKRVSVDWIEADSVRMLRMPALLKVPREPDKPLLPTIDIFIGRLDIANFIVERPVVGRRSVLNVNGKADLHDLRALVDLSAIAKDGSDRLTLKLDAAPDHDRFDVDARVIGPEGGVIAGLLKLKAPLMATLTGDGSWTRWRGALTARLGAQSLANLAVTARDGRFRLDGRTTPGLILGGMALRLGDPAIELHAEARKVDRMLKIDARALSPELSLAALGDIDLDRSSFSDFVAHVRLLRPAAFQRSMSGEKIALALELDGPLGAPTIAYRLSAPWLAVGTTRLEQLNANGIADLSASPLIVPLDASIARVTGVGDVAGGLLTRVRVAGPVRVDGLLLTSNSLSFKSDRLNGTATARIDLRTGRYDINLKGGVLRYLIPGLGLVDIATDLNVTPDNRAIHARGRATAKVVRLDSGLFRSLFEGLPTVVADIDRGPDKILYFRNARLRAPGMTATANGRLLPGNRIEMKAQGTSRRFGAFTADIAGPIARPTIRLTIRSYTAGIELRTIVATLLPQGRDYLFEAHAQSAYGPVSAQGQIVSSVQPLTIQLSRLDISGITARGNLRQTASGPFAGRLDVAGSGVSGTVDLSPAGATQRLSAALDATNAQLPFDPPVIVRRGHLDADILLTPEPRIDARFTATGLRQSDLSLRNLQGTLLYQGGSGKAALKFDGEHGVPFALEVDATLQPRSIIASLSGTIARKAVRLAEPARLTRIPGGWQLDRATLVLPTGRAIVAGSFADASRVQAELQGVGLDLLTLIDPRYNFTGLATGSLDLAQSAPGALPRGSAKLVIRDFSRVALAAGAQLFDVGINVAIANNAAVLRAVFQRNQRIFGRAQAQLSPIPGTSNDAMRERLLAAPIIGQLRWAGPAGPLWALTGVDALALRGPINVAIDVGGRLGEPRVTGRINTQRGRVESTQIGAVVEEVQLATHFAGSRLVFDSFSGKAGDGGQISGRGHIDLSIERGFPMRFDLDVSKAMIMNRDDLRATATGPLRIEKTETGGVISGNLVIDKARFRLGTASAAEFAELQVREKNPELVREDIAVAKPTVWALDIKARGNNQIDVKGLGLDSEWSANLEIGGAANQPRISGVANLIRGEYEFAGKTFELERGAVRFHGEYPADPTLDIAAQARVEGLTATLNIRGTALKPEILFSSVPAMPEDEVLSRVLFGNSIANLSAPEALQLAGAVAALRSGGGGGLDPVGMIRKAIGLDRLRFRGANEKTGQRTSIAAGEYLTDRVYVEIAADGQGFAATQIEVQLTRALSVLSAISAIGETSVSLRWSKDY